MANSFDKQKAIKDQIDAMDQCQYEMDNICAAYSRVKQKILNVQAIVNANTNGFFTNPDDLNAVNAKINALVAQLQAAMA